MLKTLVDTLGNARRRYRQEPDSNSWLGPDQAECPADHRPRCASQSDRLRCGISSHDGEGSRPGFAPTHPQSQPPVRSAVGMPNFSDVDVLQPSAKAAEGHGIHGYIRSPENFSDAPGASAAQAENAVGGLEFDYRTSCPVPWGWVRLTKTELTATCGKRSLPSASCDRCCHRIVTHSR